MQTDGEKKYSTLLLFLDLQLSYGRHQTYKKK